MKALMLSGTLFTGTVALLLVGLAGPAFADVLAGTGSLSQLHHNISLFNTQSSSGHFQFVAGKFSLGQAFRITSIDGLMYPPDGKLKVKLYGDAAGLPGGQLFSEDFTTARSQTANWTAFGPLLNWTRPAGTYWVAFEPYDGVDFGAMPGIVQNPLTSYAVWHKFSGGWTTDTGTPIDVGFRIHGNLVPEPGALVLLMTAAGSIALPRRRRCD